MPKEVDLKLNPTKELLSLVKAGRLFDLQRWVAAGKPLRASESERHPALLIQAVESGFHSMVEEILRTGEWTASELIEGFDTALQARRGDLAELLLEAGAPIQEVDFEELCSSMLVPLMRRFLESGGDPARNNAFAHALDQFKAKPLVGFYKQLRGEYPALDDQAAFALSKAVSDKTIRWTCLLIWAGADPYRKVPSNWDDGDWEDELDYTTAAAEVCWRADDAFFLAMKLKPTKEQALELCSEAASRPSVVKFEALLRGLTADDLNTGDRKSCAALEKLVEHHHWEFTTPFHYSNKDEQRIPCIELLLNRGARWNPPIEELRRGRSALGSHDGLYVVRVLRLLLYTPGAADVGLVLELCRTPKMRSLIVGADSELWDELQALRKLQP
ncbi:MAG: hypothetical protein RL693_1854 [Verrucomicrobiota bacterium]